MTENLNHLAQFTTRISQTIIATSRLFIVRASLWIMGSVWGCGLIAFVFAATGVFTINGATAQFVMEGIGMQPTIHNGDMLQVIPFNPGDKLQRGDIITLHVPKTPKEEPPLVRRIIGLPGERVEIRDTKMYINGTELNEPYIAEPCESSRCPNRVWQLGSDEYFVMGDNRNHSSDSRAFGPIPATEIIAKVLLGANSISSPLNSTVTAIVATNNAVSTLISATETARAAP